MANSSGDICSSRERRENVTSSCPVDLMVPVSVTLFGTIARAYTDIAAMGDNRVSLDGSSGADVFHFLFYFESVPEEGSNSE